MANFKSIEYTNWTAHPKDRVQDNVFERMGQFYIFTGTIITPVGGAAVGDTFDLVELPANCLPVYSQIQLDNMADTLITVASLGTNLDPIAYVNTINLTGAGAGGLGFIFLSRPSTLAGAGTINFPTVIETPTVVRLTVATNPWVANKKLVLFVNCILGGS